MHLSSIFLQRSIFFDEMLKMFESIVADFYFSKSSYVDGKSKKVI